MGKRVSADGNGGLLPIVHSGRLMLDLRDTRNQAQGEAGSRIKAAREVAAGRADLSDPDADHRLLAIPGIGTWTVRCLGLFGRGDPDALPAGDLGYVKLIGRLEGLGRRAEPEEGEEFFAPYAPFRGLAGTFALAEYHGKVAERPALRRAA